MNKKPAQIFLSMAVLASLIVLGGCQSDKLQAQRDKLWNQNIAQQQKIDHLQKALDASEQSRQGLQQRVSSLQSQLASAKAQPAPTPVMTGFDHIKGIQTKQSQGKITVQIPGDVLFASGKVTLKSSSKATLRQIAGVINNKYSGNTIRVEGYTDNDPIHKSHWKDNLQLSLARAAAVERYLESQGVKKDRMYSAGFGDTHLQSTKSKSRRVEIVVLLH